MTAPGCAYCTRGGPLSPCDAECEERATRIAAHGHHFVVWTDGVAELWADLCPDGALSDATQLGVVRQPILARLGARLEDHDGRVYVVAEWDRYGAHRRHAEPDDALPGYVETVEQVLGEVLAEGVAPTVRAPGVAA